MAPYFVTDEVDGCPRWAVVKADGSVVPSGCYASREDAIGRMVAMSIGEGIPIGGEWEKDDDSD